MSLLLRRQLDNPFHFDKALDGQLAGEVLSPYDRRVLIHVLHERGLSDRQIAAHTGWTLYTAARLRDDIGLTPNPHTDQLEVLAG